jgi:hypothetical protein
MIRVLWDYFKYVVRHKYYVFVECWKEKLYWRAITHDLSKFRPSEFFPYAINFYGKALDVPRDSAEQSFSEAWQLHIRRNPHHWEAWTRMENFETGHVITLPMPYEYVLEMVCDWRAMSRTFGQESPVGWYKENQNKMLLHTMTRRWVHQLLGIAPGTTTEKTAKITTDPDWAECERMSAVRDKSQACGEFLDWLREDKEVVLATRNEHGALHQWMFPGHERLLAEFFGIDMNKVEEERVRGLERLRKAHKEANP